MPGNEFVGGDERQSFDLGLGNQHAIERILVKRRQVEGRHGVLAGNRQFAPAIVDQPPAQPARLDAEILPAQACLTATSHRLAALNHSCAPAADDAALAALGVDPSGWSVEAMRALKAKRRWGMRALSSTLVLDAATLISAVFRRSTGAIMAAQRASVLVTTDRVVHEARRRLKHGLKRPELLEAFDDLAVLTIMPAKVH